MLGALFAPDPFDPAHDDEEGGGIFGMGVGMGMNGMNVMDVQLLRGLQHDPRLMGMPALPAPPRRLRIDVQPPPPLPAPPPLPLLNPFHQPARPMQLDIVPPAPLNLLPMPRMDDAWAGGLGIMAGQPPPPPPPQRPETTTRPLLMRELQLLQAQSRALSQAVRVLQATHQLGRGVDPFDHRLADKEGVRQLLLLLQAARDEASGARDQAVLEHLARAQEDRLGVVRDEAGRAAREEAAAARVRELARRMQRAEEAHMAALSDVTAPGREHPQLSHALAKATARLQALSRVAEQAPTEPLGVVLRLPPDRDPRAPPVPTPEEQLRSLMELGSAMRPVVIPPSPTGQARTRLVSEEEERAARRAEGEFVLGLLQGVVDGAMDEGQACATQQGRQGAEVAAAGAEAHELHRELGDAMAQLDLLARLKHALDKHVARLREVRLRPHGRAPHWGEEEELDQDLPARARALQGGEARRELVLKLRAMLDAGEPIGPYVDAVMDPARRLLAKPRPPAEEAARRQVALVVKASLRGERERADGMAAELLHGLEADVEGVEKEAEEMRAEVGRVPAFERLCQRMESEFHACYLQVPHSVMAERARREEELCMRILRPNNVALPGVAPWFMGQQPPRRFMLSDMHDRLRQARESAKLQRPVSGLLRTWEKGGFEGELVEVLFAALEATSQEEGDRAVARFKELLWRVSAQV
jgi:hypothetical protein